MAARRMPPGNPQAEESLIGCLLIDPTAYAKVVSLVAIRDFGMAQNREIFEVITELEREGTVPDMATVPDRLEAKGKLRGVGGTAYLSGLTSRVVSVANVEAYAVSVAVAAYRRRIIYQASQLAQAAYSAEDGELDSEVARIAGAVIEQKTSDQEIAIEEAVGAVEQDVAAWMADPLEIGEVRGVPTGLKRLDRMLGGLEPSLIMCAARTSVGKTALACQIAKNVARLGLPVTYVTGEMQAKQLAHRMVCAEAGLDWTTVKSGRLSARERDRLEAAMKGLSALPITIHSYCPTVEHLVAIARRDRAKRGCELLIGDYLGRFVGRMEKDRPLKLGHATAMLLDLEIQLGVPILMLDQVSRAVTERKDQRPQLQDFAWSGMIEQDADIALFLFRKELQTTHADGTPNPDGRRMEVICRKDRLNGRLGKALLHFDEFGRITDWIEQREAEERAVQEAIPF